MIKRTEVMWCTVCGARFAQDEIRGWGCPSCGNQGVPCDCTKDVRVEVNWHELHILTVWAENWAHRCAADKSDPVGAASPQVVHAIARRLQRQHPTLGHLTLSGEVAALPADLAKAGINVGSVESNIQRPGPLPINGPGAVGHSR